MFRQSPNDLSNIYLGSRAPLEEEVEHLLPDINNQDVVSEPLLQVNDEVSDMLLTSSKVDREGKQLLNPSSNSSLKSNSVRAPEPIRKKPVPAPQKLKAAVPPVLKPRPNFKPRPTHASQLNSITSGCSNESQMSASRPKRITSCCSNESLDGDLPPESIDFKRIESTLKQFTLLSLMQESHEDITPLPNIKCVEKPIFFSLTESEDNEEELDEVKKVDQEYDDLRSSLKRQEIPTDYKNTEIFDMTTIGLYSKKYKQALMLIQDQLITRGRKCTSSIKVSNNKEVDQELPVAMNSICEYLRFKDLLLSGMPYYTQSPRHLQIRKKVKKNVKINGEKMSLRYAKRRRLQFIDFAVGDNVAVKIPPQDGGKCEVNRLPAVVVLKRGADKPEI